MKSLLAKILIVIFLIIEVSCGSDIPDCPTKLCVLAGGWRLVEVYVDGVKDTSSDLSKYRLTLFMPTPTTAVTSDFDRINPSGREDTGNWQLINNSTILALLPDSSPEERYIIKSFTPRQLILVIDRDENKTGPSEYEYVLEPF
jgi:Lipocalin-like domain